MKFLIEVTVSDTVDELYVIDLLESMTDTVKSVLAEEGVGSQVVILDEDGEQL